MYPDYGYKLAHAQSVCTRPSSPRREGPGDEASNHCTIAHLIHGGFGGTWDIMHLSMACPTIPLPRETKGYQGIFTEEAGPRVGHLTFRAH